MTASRRILPSRSAMHHLVETRRDRQRSGAEAVASRARPAERRYPRQSGLAAKSSALGWLFAKNREARAPVKGLYIHGGVGRGKTMLMDLFFDLVPARRKRRVHFNAFMADVHDRIQKHRQARKNGTVKEDDPIPPVAKALADGGLGSLLRRIFGDRYRRCDDPVAAVFGAVRRRASCWSPPRTSRRTTFTATGSTASYSCRSSAC